MTDAIAFGSILRRFRLAAGLTQEELAKQSGLSVRGISDLERGARTNPQRGTRARLSQALQLGSREQAEFDLAGRTRPRKGAGWDGVGRHEPVLPVSLTSFVGREVEAAHVRSLLRRADVRLVTLTGPGGVGKTRLAVHLAEAAAQDFADGISFVPLATVRDPNLVFPAVLHALGLRDAGQRSPARSVAVALRDKHLLLILDNFEHVLAAAPTLADLLAACPALTILATSRSVLRISGEHVHAVPPLPLPDCEPLPAIEQLSDIAAIRLFVDRARAAAGFALGPGNATEVAAICHRLDGLPLAIELAARQIRLLSPRDLLNLLEHHLPVLVDGPRDLPARLQTMSDAVAWSYDLLSPEVQALFRRLSVFVGGFTISAASAICDSNDGADRDVLSRIASLVDQSLITRMDRPVGEPRFTMLETIREFGLERLAESGEIDEVRRRHAAHFLALAERVRPEMEGPRGQEVLAAIEVEHPNLRAALSWACDRREAEFCLRLTGSLWKFWQVHAHIVEGRGWLAQALAVSEGTTSRLRWQPLYAAGSFARQLGDYSRAVAYSEELLAQAKLARDDFHAALALLTLGLVAYNQGAQRAAQARLEEALPLFRALGHDHAEAMVLSFLGDVSGLQGDHAAAADHVERALATWRSRGDSWGVAIALGHMGNSLRGRGAYEPAAECYRESLLLRAQLADSLMIADCLEEWASLAAMDDQPEWAAHLLGAGARLRDRYGMPRPPACEATYRRVTETVSTLLGQRGFATAFAAGEAWTMEQIIAQATAEAAGNGQNSEAVAPNAAARRIGLTRREVAVLRLLVDGSTDQEIADALFVSRRTVTSHVASILAKLQVSSRTAAAARAIRAQLI
ncbi:MAG TPA: LuxR C-terminal-related transcriptional regulator [Thermomicrobiales bacterium]|nr:LuxR C-terminal-related transcriptional regulator [Thermomicrobiales bacterium]